MLQEGIFRGKRTPFHQELIFILSELRGEVNHCLKRRTSLQGGISITSKVSRGAFVNNTAYRPPQWERKVLDKIL